MSDNPYNIERRPDYNPDEDLHCPDELYRLWECSLRIEWIMKIIKNEWLNPKERSYTVIQLRWHLLSIASLCTDALNPTLSKIVTKKALLKFAYDQLNPDDKFSYWKYLELTDEQRGAFKSMFKDILPKGWDFKS